MDAISTLDSNDGQDRNPEQGFVWTGAAGTTHNYPSLSETGELCWNDPQFFSSRVTVARRIQVLATNLQKRELCNSEVNPSKSKCLIVGENFLEDDFACEVRPT